MRQHAPFVDSDALPPAVLGKFETQPTLADARLADDADHPAVPMKRLIEFAFERSELVAASDQGAQPAAAPEHIACRRIQELGQLERFDRRSDPANGLRAERLDFDELPGG